MRKPRVTIQGTEASFHHQAAAAIYGTEMDLVPCHTFEAQCRAIIDNQADYAVMAIENSTAGSILGNYELIYRYRLFVHAEHFLPIQLNLLGTETTELTSISRVRSHPMALRQCSGFLSQHSAWKLEEGSDTAFCAEQLQKSQETDLAVIASTWAAERYQLKILAANIEEDKHNVTRFFCLGKGQDICQNPDKATLSLRLEHRPGALSEILQVFHAAQVNLSKIQSVPVIGQPGKYLFYLDVEWLEPGLYKHALQKVAQMALELKVLGSYRKKSWEDLIPLHQQHKMSQLI